MRTHLFLKKGFIRIVFITFLCFFFINVTSAFEEKFETTSFHQELKSEDLKLVSHSFQVLSTNEYGATYLLEVTNNSTTDLRLDISAANKYSDYENPDNSPINNNVELKSEFYDEDYINSIESIQLKTGASYKFKVTTEVQDSTPVRQWNCTEVKLTPDSEGLSPVSILLHTYVSDLSQD